MSESRGSIQNPMSAPETTAKVSIFTDKRLDKRLDKNIKPENHTIITSKDGRQFELLGKFTDREIEEFISQTGIKPGGCKTKRVTMSEANISFTKIRIGEGHQGTVKYARQVHPNGSKGDFFAVKIIKKNLDTYTKEKELHELITKEKTSGLMLPTDTIYSVDRLGYETIYQIMPLATGGDGNYLKNITAKHSSQDKEFRLLLLRQLLNKLLNSFFELQKLGVYHNDFKLANLLFSINGDIFVADFGSSTIFNASLPDGKLFLDDKADIMLRLPRLIAQQLENKYGLEKAYYERIDNWALGITLAQLASTSANTFIEKFLTAHAQDIENAKTADEQKDYISSKLNKLRLILTKDNIPAPMVEMIIGLLNPNWEVENYLKITDIIPSLSNIASPLSSDELNEFAQKLKDLTLKFPPETFAAKKASHEAQLLSSSCPAKIKSFYADDKSGSQPLSGSYVDYSSANKTDDRELNQSTAAAPYQSFSATKFKHRLFERSPISTTQTGDITKASPTFNTSKSMG